MVRSAQVSADRLLSEALKLRPAMSCSKARAVGASDPPHKRKLAWRSEDAAAEAGAWPTAAAPGCATAAPGCATTGLFDPVDNAEGPGVPQGVAELRSPSV